MSTEQTDNIELLSSMRRMPTQKRSRERVARMLDSAIRLISEKGSDALKMSEVADLAGVPIGSLYQYFPDKSAIVRTLAEHYNAQGRACSRAALDRVKDEAGLRAALVEIIDGFYAMYRSEPVMRDLWSATLADRSLQAIDAEDGAAHAAMLEETLLRLYPAANRERIAISALLVNDLLASSVRRAIDLPVEAARALLAGCTGMATRELAAIAAQANGQV